MLIVRKLRTLNPEWLRDPFSRLEETLRFPYLVRYALETFTKRIAVWWLGFSFLLQKSFFGFPFSIVLGFVLAIGLEMLLLRRWYQKTVLSKHLSKLEKIKGLYERRNDFSTKELIKAIEESVKLASWGTIKIGYVGLASWGWEIVFRWLYPFMVRTRKIPYYDLLIGFTNKSTEADQALWEVAGEKNDKKRREKLESYLEKYGSRVEDMDLARPTFREQPEAINSLLKLYSQTSSPRLSLDKAGQRRKMALQSVLTGLRIPRSMFLKFLDFVRENVVLREDRRYYVFLADYHLRTMIILLGKRLGFDGNEVFNRSWKELKDEAN